MLIYTYIHLHFIESVDVNLWPKRICKGIRIFWYVFYNSERALYSSVYCCESKALSLVFWGTHTYIHAFASERVFTATAPPPPTHTVLTARSISWIEWPQKPEKQLPSASNWMCIDECRQFKEFARGISREEKLPKYKMAANIKLCLCLCQWIHNEAMMTMANYSKKSSSLTTKKGFELLSLTHSWCKLRLWNNKHARK